MVDSAHAALMIAGHTPPSPEHVYDMLKKVFPKINKKLPEDFKEMYTLVHNITHGNVKTIKGKQIDELQEKAENFVKEMKFLVKKLE